MNIFFGGVRGTAPRAAPGYTRYGGHTTCLLVSGQQGEILVIDAGSGIQEINRHLLESDRRDLLLLLTHLHLDHIMGLPTLSPLYDPDWRVRMLAGGHTGAHLARVVDRVTTPPVWPISLADMGAEVDLADHVPDAGPIDWGGLKITGTAVPHPGGCFAWRVDEPATGASFVFSTDTEWSAEAKRQDRGLRRLCTHPNPADLLVMDGQFTAEELPAHAGWGHSSIDQCAEAAIETGVGRLLVTHHHPDSTDDTLDRLEQELSRLFPGAALARQGDTIELGR